MPAAIGPIDQNWPRSLATAAPHIPSAGVVVLVRPTPRPTRTVMATQDFTLDMTYMYLFHDALRRDLERIARFTDSRSDDPKTMLRSAAGWEMFKKYLRIHHQAEDDAVWPVMYEKLTDRPDDLALLDAMESE